ncbi:MAG: hypothetical protein ACW98J_08485 [Candidatus Thorarchaeota archaeon]|jgi:hypothetical protein
MSKTLTKDEVNMKKFRRINDKSLRQHLTHRFLNSYGYDKGEVTAQAIVDDILKTIEHYFVVRKPLEQMAQVCSASRKCIFRHLKIQTLASSVY